MLSFAEMQRALAAANLDWTIRVVRAYPKVYDAQNEEPIGVSARRVRDRFWWGNWLFTRPQTAEELEGLVRQVSGLLQQV